MLSKGFVEAHLRMYLKSTESFPTTVYSISENTRTDFHLWPIMAIVYNFDLLRFGYYFNIFTLDNTIELYSDCIKVYSSSGELLHEYREEVEVK